MITEIVLLEILLKWLRIFKLDAVLLLENNEDVYLILFKNKDW